MENSFRDILLGDILGEGVSRIVYINKLDDTKVIKLAKNNKYFSICQNCNEYFTWDRIGYDLKFNKWLAPCINISNDGKILIQERTYPLSKKEFDKFISKDVPHFMADFNIDNFGWYDDRIVMHDYAILNIDSTLGKASD